MADPNLHLLQTEFQELRKEIERRSHEQQLLVPGSILSAVAVFGAATKK